MFRPALPGPPPRPDEPYYKKDDKIYINQIESAKTLSTEG